MKHLPLILILFAAPSLHAQPAAEPTPPSTTEAATATTETPAAALVRQTLLEPLAAKESERSKFSRMAMPAAERRVRLLDAQPRHDARGKAFVRFAVDERHGFDALDTDWQLATISGCAYVERGEVFVHKGDEYRPAAFLLGKRLKAAPASTCVGDGPVAAIQPAP